MTPCEKVSQLLTLTRSTPFVGERESAVRLARSLFNKHRLTDARLRWDLLHALGLEAGPEPVRPRASSPAGASEDEDWAAWRAWMAAEQAEQERWTRAWMKRAQLHACGRQATTLAPVSACVLRRLSACVPTLVAPRLPDSLVHSYTGVSCL